MRPMTADELNRRFQSYSVAGVHSTNPYTYGNAERPEQESEDRFTVFLLSVKNYEYPKVYVDPRNIALYADNDASTGPSTAAADQLLPRLQPGGTAATSTAGTASARTG